MTFRDDLQRLLDVRGSTRSPDRVLKGVRPLVQEDTRLWDLHHNENDKRILLVSEEGVHCVEAGLLRDSWLYSIAPRQLLRSAAVQRRSFSSTVTEIVIDTTEGEVIYRVDFIIDEAIARDHRVEQALRSANRLAEEIMLLAAKFAREPQVQAPMPRDGRETSGRGDEELDSVLHSALFAAGLHRAGISPDEAFARIFDDLDRRKAHLARIVGDEVIATGAVQKWHHSAGALEALARETGVDLPALREWYYGWAGVSVHATESGREEPSVWAPPPAPDQPPVISAPRPDWYRDSTGRHQLRYWDGGQWTMHVSDDGVQSSDPI